MRVINMLTDAAGMNEYFGDVLKVVLALGLYVLLRMKLFQEKTYTIIHQMMQKLKWKK